MFYTDKPVGILVGISLKFICKLERLGMSRGIRKAVRWFYLSEHFSALSTSTLPPLRAPSPERVTWLGLILTTVAVVLA
jgi:hypothetical protein